MIVQQPHHHRHWILGPLLLVQVWVRHIEGGITAASASNKR